MRWNHINWIRGFSNASYIIGAAFLIASLLTSLMPPKVVSAHHAIVSGSATCQSNGTYVINWSIRNWSDVNGPMTITGIDRSIGVSVGTQVDINGVTAGRTQKSPDGRAIWTFDSDQVIPLEWR